VQLCAEQLALLTSDMLDVCLGPEVEVHSDVDPAVYRRRPLKKGEVPSKGDIEEERWNTFLDKWLDADNPSAAGSDDPESVKKQESNNRPHLLTSDGKVYPATKIPLGEGYHDRLAAAAAARVSGRAKTKVKKHVYSLESFETKTTRITRRNADPLPSGSELVQDIRLGRIRVVRVQRSVGPGYMSVEYHLVRTDNREAGDRVPLPPELVIQEKTPVHRQLLQLPTMGEVGESHFDV
jgi:hypothetical protein